MRQVLVCLGAKMLGQLDLIMAWVDLEDVERHFVEGQYLAVHSVDSEVGGGTAIS